VDGGDVGREDGVWVTIGAVEGAAVAADDGAADPSGLGAAQAVATPTVNARAGRSVRRIAITCQQLYGPDAIVPTYYRRGGYHRYRTALVR
jgi:hypothetical protein